MSGDKERDEQTDDEPRSFGVTTVEKSDSDDSEPSSFGLRSIFESGDKK